MCYNKLRDTDSGPVLPGDNFMTRKLHRDFTMNSPLATPEIQDDSFTLTKAAPPAFLVLRNGGAGAAERSSAKTKEEMETLIARQVTTAGGQTKIAYVYQLVFAVEHVHSSKVLSPDELTARFSDSLKESNGN